jgi:threonine dehydratase
VASVGGGGLLAGVGSALRSLAPGIALWAAEPETAAPLALSLAQGSPQRFPDWQPSFVDGAGGQSVFPRMWERMRPLVSGSIVVSLEETRTAMRLLAEKARVIAEAPERSPWPRPSPARPARARSSRSSPAATSTWRSSASSSRRPRRRDELQAKA